LRDFEDFIEFCENYNTDIPSEILERKKEAILDYFEKMKTLL